MAKQPKTSAELEDMILQKLLIGGVYVSVRRDPIFGWQARRGTIRGNAVLRHFRSGASIKAPLIERLYSTRPGM